MKTPELIPCPFCGGDDVEIQNSFAGSKKPVCMDCGASLHPSRSEEAAIHEWNTRVYPPEVQELIAKNTPTHPLDIFESEQWEGLIEGSCPFCGKDVDDSEDECDSCGQRLEWEAYGNED